VLFADNAPVYTRDLHLGVNMLLRSEPFITRHRNDSAPANRFPLGYEAAGFRTLPYFILFQKKGVACNNFLFLRVKKYSVELYLHPDRKKGGEISRPGQR
jgi:hypothetical protein